MERTIEDHFTDWESHTFGFGYGSGEEPVISALQTFLQLCDGRGQKDSTQYDYEVIEAALGKPVAWLLINALGRADIIEYGTSARYAWLTPQGVALKGFMLSWRVDYLCAIVFDGWEKATYCTPEFCNCGPDGYSKKKLCHNPFWVERPT